MFKRPVAGLPTIVNQAHQATVDFRFHGQTGQLIRRNRIDEVRKAFFNTTGCFCQYFSKNSGQLMFS
jgi:hypothetical protein